ncbi:VirB3 family type IV secretion system protein [Massilia sp. R2A-15]|uniref:type IV secretion system protein VirB3 n=1 Tax=Massilia sp. R2A-15 TaxID=3064278 RepID=UPI0027374FE4|nr:VirB3 family type IV secretion system protein [Massilia sp. R2A-15]WLI91084.1 VirB3 family type IV secretion system protein [Massilia sp. R2A-15]
MSTFRDPIFRGCTRPATFGGVPMVPGLLVTGAFLIAGGWLCYLASAYAALFMLTLYIPIMIAMRAVTRRDDQRLHQLMMRAKMRWRQRAGVRQWSAISYSPLRYKRRKEA